MGDKKKKRSKQQTQPASGDVITARVGDGATGVAVGKDIIQTVHNVPGELTEADKLNLDSALSGLNVDSVQMRQVLTEKFNDQEVRNLCFDLAVDYDDLPGLAKGDKARELILFCVRHDRLQELVELCRRLRPSVF